MCYKPWLLWSLSILSFFPNCLHTHNICWAHQCLKYISPSNYTTEFSLCSRNCFFFLCQWNSNGYNQPGLEARHPGSHSSDLKNLSTILLAWQPQSQTKKKTHKLGSRKLSQSKCHFWKYLFLSDNTVNRNFHSDN